LNILVADNADVDFPSFNILFGDGGRLVLPVNELHSLNKFVVVVHHRGLRNPNRSFFTYGFDQ
jgi:hypothetical protein